MNREYTYDIGKYIIGVDENGEDGIGLTVAMVENNEIKFLGNCYGDNARCIDLLIQENQKLKDILNKIKTEIEEKIRFCESEAEGHINHEKCNIAIRFLKKLLDDLEEV